MTSMARIINASLLLPFLASQAAAADLTRIDRAVGREPAYKSKPEYCLLVFGPEAKTRVWLVRDQDVLYVDRNGNGDLTEKGKGHVGVNHPKCIHWEIGEIVEADGRTRHTDLGVRFESGSWLLWLRTADGLRQEVGNEVGRLQFAARPQDAPIIHFAGPLTFLRPAFWEKLVAFTPGAEAHFTILLGTPGLGGGAAAYGYSEGFGKPGAVRIVVDAEFPGRVQGTTVRARNVCTDF
jgi:hypothetical protein